LEIPVCLPLQQVPDPRIELTTTNALRTRIPVSTKIAWCETWYLFELEMPCCSWLRSGTAARLAVALTALTLLVLTRNLTQTGTLVEQAIDWLWAVSPTRRHLVLAWLQDGRFVFAPSNPKMPSQLPANASALAPSINQRLYYILGPSRVARRSHNLSLPSSHVGFSPFVFTCGVTAASVGSVGQLLYHYVRDTSNLCALGFDQRTRIVVQYGDLRPAWTPMLPRHARLFVKSRRVLWPGSSSAAYAAVQRPVLLPLNVFRHFGAALMRHDSYVPWDRKRSALVWRGSTTGFNGLRREFVHGLANFSRRDVDVRFVGVVQGREGWVRGMGVPPVASRLSRLELLSYRYVLSLEGNDVASDLKWLMGHNSVVVMPPPTVESWLLEGLLRPYVHYVPVRSAADVPAALAWMRANEAACLGIVANANAWVEEIMRSTTETSVELIRRGRIDGSAVEDSTRRGVPVRPVFTESFRL
jgi:hypothetical protein